MRKVSNNPNGRPKGSPNKSTASTREIVNKIVNDNLATFDKDLKALSPKDRINALVALLNYTLPKLQSVEAKVDVNQLSSEQLSLVAAELLNNLN